MSWNLLKLRISTFEVWQRGMSTIHPSLSSNSSISSGFKPTKSASSESWSASTPYLDAVPTLQMASSYLVLTQIMNTSYQKVSFFALSSLDMPLTSTGVNCYSAEENIQNREALEVEFYANMPALNWQRTDFTASNYLARYYQMSAAEVTEANKKVADAQKTLSKLIPFFQAPAYWYMYKLGTKMYRSIYLNTHNKEKPENPTTSPDVSFLSRYLEIY